MWERIAYRTFVEAPPVMNTAPQPDRVAWYQRLVDSMLDDVHRHVRLVYPYALTHPAVVATFRRALHAGRPAEAPGDRAWLFGLARDAIRREARDVAEFERLNAAAIVYGVREVAEQLTGQTQLEALASVDALATLPPSDQHLLRLQTVEGFDRHELAWILGLDSDDAAYALSAAEERLRAAAAQSEPGSGAAGGESHE
jgi:DNA-directed RNA polymerase specialized sigma24 family protein